MCDQANPQLRERMIREMASEIRRWLRDLFAGKIRYSTRNQAEIRVMRNVRSSTIVRWRTEQ